MFEDLIGKSIVTKLVEIFDIQNQCPHCKTDNIVKRVVSRFVISKSVMRTQQPAYCPKCRKLWYIASYEDENGKEDDYIEHMSKKSGEKE